MKKNSMKAAALLLALIMIMSLAACGRDGRSAAGQNAEGTAAGSPQNQDSGEASSENEGEEGSPVLPWQPVNSGYIPSQKIEGSSLYVDKVENLPEDFIFGMDASAVISEEASGVRYFGFDGTEQDVFLTLAQSGINYIRVRVWNNPFDPAGNGFGGGNCDINNAVEIGKRATRYGMKLLVDFHYSDFWADPSKQMVPLAWKDMTIEEKTEAAYSYTVECLNKLRDAGVDVGMVQIGNETNGTFCGESIWFNIQYLMAAGSKAVREVYPGALVALHFTNPEKVTNYADYAKKLDYYSIDYDVFASSYYPYWHGTLENLAAVLTDVAEKYDKKVMVVETSYAYTADDSDFYGNTISDGGAVTKNYPYTVQGQANCMRAITDTLVNKTANAIGIVYWEGTWISVGTDSYEENAAKWEQFGSGWATRFAAGYDPKDAGKYYGGNAVDNQAFFDPEGKPLESLRVFNLMRYGNEVELKADAIEDITLIVDLNAELELPGTVNAVMSDDSRQALPVEWKLTDADRERMHSAGPAKYDVEGTAGGMTAHCYVSMIEYNFLNNYSFEDGVPGPWVITDLAAADELYVENKPTDSLTGDWHMHFWSSAKDSVKFTIEQPVEGLKSGSYKYTVSIMGGDCGDTDIYAYVKLDGELAATVPMTITSYGNWDTETVDSFSYTEGQDLVVGVYVCCAGEGNGAWGKIDDAMLNSVSDN